MSCSLARSKFLWVAKLASTTMFAVVVAFLLGLAMIELPGDASAQAQAATDAAIWPTDAAYRAGTLAEDLTFPAEAEVAAKLT